MGDLINLKRIVKRRARDNASKLAEMNRVKFGRTKLQRDNDTAEAVQKTRALDQHKLSKKDGT